MDIELEDLNTKFLQGEDSSKEHSPKIESKKSKIVFKEGQRTAHFSGYRTGYDPENTNRINNRKYTILNFVPKVLFEQFKYFFNMFFLLLCLSQFIPIFQVGLLFSYVAPLAFVLVMTLLKEGYDDYKRWVRDKETNNASYNIWSGVGFIPIPSSELQEGQIIELNSGDRIPADCVLLWTSDPSESIFIKTDQLDGETDWKLRNPIVYTQKQLKKSLDMSRLSGYVTYEQPNKEIYKFKGLFVNQSNRNFDQPLNLENTLWNSTVLCSSRALALIVYIGGETRIAMNLTEAREKMGTLDKELNSLSKFLCAIMLLISLALYWMSNSSEHILISVVKYILLLSSIIPVSLRVNLDFSKIVFTYKMSSDKEINTVVRNSQIPEELGRIGIILSDKTGTLTRNEM